MCRITVDISHLEMSLKKMHANIGKSSCVKKIIVQYRTDKCASGILIKAIKIKLSDSTSLITLFFKEIIVIPTLQAVRKKR